MILSVNKHFNKYELVIIITIFSAIFAGTPFRAFIPVRVIGLFASYFYLRSSDFRRTIHTSDIKPLKLFFKIFLAYSFIAVLWTSDVKLYLIDALSSYCYVFDCLLIFYCSRKSRDPIKVFVFAWILLTIANLACGCWELTTGNHFDEGNFYHEKEAATDIVEFRPYSAVTYGNYNSLSILHCFSLLFILLSYKYASIVKKLFFILLYFCIGVILMINASRGSLICYVFFIIPFIYENRTNKKTLLLIIALMVTIGSWLYILFGNEIMMILDMRFGEGINMSDEPRTKLIQIGLHVIQEWFGIGSGPGSMIHQYEMSGMSYGVNYCHNLWLQILLEYGLVLFVMFFVMIFVMIKRQILSHNPIIKLVGIYMLICYPVLTIIDEQYHKPFQWLFLISVYSIYYNLSHPILYDRNDNIVLSSSK